jgi:dihydrofolate synthase/folylpolyglutamate synthase
LPVSFFETTIAASFLAFSRTPADACVIEVGLGGRLDATNVIERPAVCGIASLGIDHERFLLAAEDGAPREPLARIAWEKAGIAKPGVPLVTQAYPTEATREIEALAGRVGAPLAMRGQDWFADIGSAIAYRDGIGELLLPLPALPGAHQAENAALAVAMLRHQQAVTVSPEAMAAGIRAATWPARLQRLGPGPLTDLTPNRTIWLDGGHNPDAGAALARHFGGQRFHLILGMLANKEPGAITTPLAANVASLQVVDIPGHEAHPASAFGPMAKPAKDVSAALSALSDDGLPVLVGGSLYLSGEVLRLNREFPD